MAGDVSGDFKRVLVSLITVSRTSVTAASQAKPVCLQCVLGTPLRAHCSVLLKTHFIPIDKLFVQEFAPLHFAGLRAQTFPLIGLDHSLDLAS